uniref:Uncharacterized protein n=2 Tax=Magallana gigas TaxID=29159 RepID=A0A8W8LMF3_MAGGI
MKTTADDARKLPFCTLLKKSLNQTICYDRGWRDCPKLTTHDKVKNVPISKTSVFLAQQISKSAEQLNIDVRPPLQRSQTVFSADDTSDPNADGYLQPSLDIIQVGSPNSVRSKTLKQHSNSIDSNADDYLQPCTDIVQNVSNSSRKIAIVNPTTHVVHSDKGKDEVNDPFEESLYQNVEPIKTPHSPSKVLHSPSKAEQVKKEKGEEAGSIYQNVEPLVCETKNSENEMSEYQNFVVKRESITKPTKPEDECEYEFVQRPLISDNDQKLTKTQDVNEEECRDRTDSVSKVNLRKNSTTKTGTHESKPPTSVIKPKNFLKNFPNKSSSAKPAKKPKPARPPPPKFSDNISRFRNRYTSPDLTPQPHNKVPEKSLSVDSHVSHSMSEPAKTVSATADIRGKMMFRNARSASEQMHVVRRSDNIHDYFDMSNSRPGELVLDDGDDYMPMSLEDKCPLDRQ